jgi:hypothetical protein
MRETESLLSRARAQRHRLTDMNAARAAVHGHGRIGEVNKWLAVRITKGVGTMWCAYVFAALALVSLPAAIQSGNPVILVSWLSQTFLQLVLLSIIIVGQQVLSEAADQRAEADHETLELLPQINTTQLAILNQLQEVVVERQPGEPPSDTTQPGGE